MDQFRSLLLLSIVLLAQCVWSKPSDIETRDFDMQSQMEERAAGEMCSGVVDVCIYCDRRCQFQILVTGESNYENYFQKLLAKMTKVFLDSHIYVTFALHKSFLPRNNDFMKQYAQSGVIGQRLTETANKNFWINHHFQDMIGDGCDMGLLLAEDNLWHTAGTTGAGFKCSMCTKHSVAAVQLDARNIDKTAAIAAHEAGHLLCMDHDSKAPNSGFDSPKFSPYNDLLNANCRVGYSGCPDRNCVMVDPLPAFDYPQRFSACSKGYFAFWCQYPNAGTYDRTCLNPDELQEKYYGTNIEVLVNGGDPFYEGSG